VTLARSSREREIARPDLIQVPDSRDPTLEFDTVIYGNGYSDTVYAGTGNDWVGRPVGNPGNNVLVAYGTGSGCSPTLDLLPSIATGRQKAHLAATSSQVA
jgi:hypothetical protein